MFYTFATHSGLVLDVIDTVCSQNGSNHDMSIFTKQGKKSSRFLKINFWLHILRSIPIDRVRGASSHWFPFNRPASGLAGYMIQEVFSTDAVSALRKIWELIRLWKLHSAQAPTLKRDASAQGKIIKFKKKVKKNKCSVSIQTILVLFLLA